MPCIQFQPILSFIEARFRVQHMQKRNFLNSGLLYIIAKNMLYVKLNCGIISAERILYDFKVAHTRIANYTMSAKRSMV